MRREAPENEVREAGWLFLGGPETQKVSPMSAGEFCLPARLGALGFLPTYLPLTHLPLPAKAPPSCRLSWHCSGKGQGQTTRGTSHQPPMWVQRDVGTYMGMFETSPEILCGFKSEWAFVPGCVCVREGAGLGRDLHQTGALMPAFSL